MVPFKVYETYERTRLFEEYNRKEEMLMYSLRGRETLYLQDLHSGMVLAETVLDRSGNRLLNSDVTLDESKIEKLKRRGISSVKVKPEERFHKF